VTRELDETHRADLRSWIASAEHADTDFPIQNLPLGCVRTPSGTVEPVVAIGDDVLHLPAALELLRLDTELTSALDACRTSGKLNPLLALGHAAMRRLRSATSALLRDDTPEGEHARTRASEMLSPMAGVEPILPLDVGDYTDFYASIDHATNVGGMFRPDNPLLPNYKWVPIGYHGRASSIVPSGTAVRRPRGQTRDDPDAVPTFGPSRRLDYELEVGAVIGRGNPLGAPIPIGRAESHVAALCLVNDWSARDIQTWEYQPLGPFLAKSFATTMSPWLVTLEALAPFRVAPAARESGDPAPLDHLADDEDAAAGSWDIELEVWIRTERMRTAGAPPFRVSRARFDRMYWTFAQMVAHHTSNGCNLRPGDLLASGTVSGPSPESRGSLLERTWRGTEPLALPSGESRRFLEDGDEVIMRGMCERSGFRRIGFGECRGTVSAG
jgi:fumarylacetoacetase